MNCEILNNGQYGIYFDETCLPTFGSSLSEWNDIYGNGSGSPDRDLRNGTEDIEAHYVYWGTIIQSEIENRIHHNPDDSSLGLVNFDYWTNVTHDEVYTGIFEEKVDNTPEVFLLAQNHPNPFIATTTIKYGLPKSSDVHIVIYDVLGQEVRTLVNKEEDAGYYTVIWGGRDNSGKKVRSGTYLLKYTIRSAGEASEQEPAEYSGTAKLVLMR